MAAVQWIRINTDMFDNSKIKYIRTLPSGNDLVVIWVMLLTKAGKCNSNGFIFLTENIPYTADMLAAEFGFEINTINLALNTFANLNMIQLEDSKILITGWEEHQNIEGLEKIREQTRKRVARHREKLALQMESMTCQYCGSKATGYDHIIATARGGEDVESNKVPCCIECNRIKNDKPLVDFLNSNRDRINDNIVLANEKLIKHVTLCNVTDRYTVTQSNATDKNKNKKRIDKDKDINNKKEKEKKVSGLDEIINNYTSNLDLKETLQDFLKMRKSQKKPMTDRALKTLLKKLDTLATTDEEKIERLEESICNCWLTVYPKKNNYNSYGNRSPKEELNNFSKEEYKKLKQEINEQFSEENIAKYNAEFEDIDF